MQLDFNHNGFFYSAFSVEDARAALVPEVVIGAAAVGQAKQGIDGAASRARARHATVIDGQDSMYMIKADEAQRYIAAGTPDNAVDYVLLQAESAALGITPQEQAVRVLEARDAWLLIAARIEAARISGKAALDGLQAFDAVIASRDSTIAVLDAI